MKRIIAITLTLAASLSLRLEPLAAESPAESPNREARLSRSFEEGLALFYRRQYSRVVEHLERVVVSEGDDQRLLALMSDARSELGDLRGAVSDLARAIAAGPPSGLLFRKRAFLYYALRMPTEAISDSDRSIELTPRDDRAWLVRALACWLSNDSDGMIQNATKCVSLNAANGTGFFVRASAYRLQRKFELASQDFQEAMIQNPELAPECLAPLAIAQAYSFKPEAARKTVERGLAEFPNDQRLLYVKGLTLKCGGQHRAAVDALTAAIAVGGKHPHALLWRAQAYAALEEFEPALADVAAAIDSREQEFMREAYEVRAAIYGQMGDTQARETALRESLSYPAATFR